MKCLAWYWLTSLKLYNSRLDIALGHLPEDRSMVTEEEALWINYHTLLDVLGPEGMSSDKSDVNDAGHRMHWDKRVDWWDKNVTKRMVDVDKDRNIMNGYGNIRAGNLARFCKQQTDGWDTSRNALLSSPINLYDMQWYASLRPGQRRELAAAPEVSSL